MISSSPSPLRLRVRRLTCAALFVLLSAAFAAAQTTTSTTDGTTPSGLAPGSPSGSYTLSDFDGVNPYNGNLNFALPLLGVSGRGGARAGVTLKIDGVRWKVDKDDSDGMTSYSANPNWWEGIVPGYGPGVLQGRKACFVSPVTNRCTMALTRLTFTASDGTEYELRDQLYGGQPKSAGSGGISRGTTFISADGTAVTFVSDAAISDPSLLPGMVFPSGYLMLSDGTRYRIDHGTITWLRDRNGNRVSFGYDASARVTSITDSLKRQVTINYANLTTVMYDAITYKGFGGADRTIKVWRGSLGSALRTTRTGDVGTPQTYGQLFPEVGSGNQTLYNPNNVAKAVELPDERRYQLFYNPYGELARVVLPTGGAVEYDYTPGSGVLDYGDLQIYRRVTERRVYADGTNLEGKQVYSASYSAPGSAEPWYTTATVEQRGATGALLAASKHYFYGSPAASLFAFSYPTLYPSWKEGREYQTEALHTDGTTVLRRTAQTWQQRAAVAWWTGSADDAPVNDPRVVENTLTLVDANRVSKTSAISPVDGSVGFDQYNNRTDVYEYDFGTGGAGAFVRRTHTDYVASSAYTDATTGPSLRRLPSQQWVSSDAAGTNKKALTTFEYDNYTPDALHAPLVDRIDASPSISGLDPAFTTSYTARGNLTGTTSYANAAAQTGAVTTAAQYDVAGNVVKGIDARGYATTYSFADRFGSPDGEARTNAAPSQLAGQATYAFVTSITNALGHTSYGQYDYFMARAVDGEDVNGVVASGYFNDALDRPTRVVRAVGTTIQSQTTFAYNDAGRVVTRTSDLNSYNDNLLKSESVYDGLGRTVESRQYEPGGDYSMVRTTYDALGRASQASNPFRTGQTPAWTTTGYDALGRVLTVTTPDGAVVSTSYSGSQVTVTDQAGKQRRSVSDSLGRLTSVVEDPAGLNYQTTYGYDVLGSLTTVVQGQQTRTFVYDSLKRLTSATNPESGTVSCTYDAGGNVLTRTDARGITTTYSYDALGRSTYVDYSNTAVNPDVELFYDNPAAGAYGKGRFWHNYAGGDTNQGSDVEHTAIDSYDAMGRPRMMRQLSKTAGAWGPTYGVQRTYDLAGGVLTETYPSGHAVNYKYDDAGRPGDRGTDPAFSGNLGGTQRTYASGLSYDEASRMREERFGTTTPLYHKLHYNVRGQLYDVRLSTASWQADEWGADRGALINYYATADMSAPSHAARAQSGPDNNGNLLRAETYTLDQASNWAAQAQGYGYDALNRLTAVSESQITQGGTVSQFQQAYTYDRWGNRQINAAATSSGINSRQFTIDTATNRLMATGMAYDASGNLTQDTYSAHAAQRAYDAEGRMTSEQDSITSIFSRYSYDAAGKRTRRDVGGVVTWQVYGFGGELLAEYAGGAAPASPQKEYGYRGGELLVVAEAGGAVNWLVSDHLGTPRMVVDPAGSLGGIKRHDYLPFGEELQAGMGGRTTAQGYSADNVRQHYTGYERDAETGLDFAQARYYSNQQGRFTSPDPFAGSMKESDPQSLNHYSYVGNNPMNSTDPSGLDKLDAAGEQRSMSYAMSQGYDPPVDHGKLGLDREFDYDLSSEELRAAPQPEPQREAEGETTSETSITLVTPGVQVTTAPLEPSGSTLQVRGRAGSSLSRGNPLRFPSNRRTLGPAYLAIDGRYGWQIEITGTTPDDVSTWYLYQAFDEVAVVTLKAGKPLRSVNSGAEPISYTQWADQPKGGHRVYFIDAPGFDRNYSLEPNVVSIHSVKNFTSYMSKGNDVRKVEWSVELKIARGRLVEAYFRPHHVPLP
jgi:RHS repeat-associated protein